MPDHHYENPRLAALYDLDSGWSVDRDFYLALAHGAPRAILDLGCGTGLLCGAYAGQGHSVTGVDPSDAMLDVGRRKYYGKNIEWVRSLSQSYESDRRFDLIIMTGHAFQVLLDDKDIAATCDVMRRHIKPDGLIVFESRNPEIDWAKRWDYSIDIESAEGRVRETRRFMSMNGDRMTFELHYAFRDQTLKSESELRFLSRKELEARLTQAGLRVERVLGDWQGGAFDAQRSEEMIFEVRAA